ncbi:MAG: DUF4093 domain-containing protein [Eubacterium sp.]|nr:DUF4093 domain-containing protein [Eubacterium sp.]
MQDKLTLKQAVIVEGKYDKAKLSSVLDALIITTDGFGIFKDKEKKALIRSLAESVGIIILTDSDTAGFRIRNHIKGFVQNGKITNIYIPQIKGKERRKEAPSAEGLLGVEGMDTEVLRKALSDADIIAQADGRSDFLDNARMLDDGLIGSPNASYKRRRLLAALGLPERLSSKAAAEIINRLFSEDEYTAALSKIN